MSELFKIKNYLVIALFALLGMIVIILVNDHFKLKKQLSEVISSHNSITAFYSDSISNLNQKVTRYGDTLSQARQTILSYESALMLGVIKEDDLKRKLLVQVTEITRLQELIRILDRPGTYPDTVYLSADDCIHMPLRMEFKDPNYYVHVTATKFKPVLDSLQILSYPVLTVGLQKDPGLMHILQKPYPVIIYDNTNPYIKVIDIQSTPIYKPVKWYQTDGAKIGFGAGLGLLFSHFLR